MQWMQVEETSSPKRAFVMASGEGANNPPSPLAAARGMTPEELFAACRFEEASSLAQEQLASWHEEKVSFVGLALRHDEEGLAMILAECSGGSVMYKFIRGTPPLFPPFPLPVRPHYYHGTIYPLPPHAAVRCSNPPVLLTP